MPFFVHLGPPSAFLCNARTCDCCLRARQGNVTDSFLQTLGVTTQVLNSHITLAWLLASLQEDSYWKRRAQHPSVVDLVKSRLGGTAFKLGVFFWDQLGIKHLSCCV